MKFLRVLGNDLIGALVALGFIGLFFLLCWLLFVHPFVFFMVLLLILFALWMMSVWERSR